MKLVIQIPAWDEEEQIAAAVRELPRQVRGFSSVEVLVVDDGSTDATSRVASEAGADHVLRLGIHRGLAVAWRAGLDRALALGADVIVSTDADRQYAAADVVTLVDPILKGEAEIVVGDRGVATKADFSPGNGSSSGSARGSCGALPGPTFPTPRRGSGPSRARRRSG